MSKTITIAKKEVIILTNTFYGCMNSITIKPLPFATQALFYCKNLFRLIDQELYWFCERITALSAGNYSRVEYLEKTYLEPLNSKIKELAERMSRL